MGPLPLANAGSLRLSGRGVEAVRRHDIEVRVSKAKSRRLDEKVPEPKAIDARARLVCVQREPGNRGRDGRVEYHAPSSLNVLDTPATFDTALMSRPFTGIRSPFRSNSSSAR